MPIVTGIHRDPSNDDRYEVMIDWGNETRKYVVSVFEEQGIRGLGDTAALDAELHRCPTLPKQIVRLVFEVHDGRPVRFPVPVALLSTSDSP